VGIPRRYPSGGPRKQHGVVPHGSRITGCYCRELRRARNQRHSTWIQEQTFSESAFTHSRPCCLLLHVGPVSCHRSMARPTYGQPIRGGFQPNCLASGRQILSIKSKLVMICCIQLWTRTDSLTKTPWLLIRKRNIPTERPPLIGQFLLPTFADRGVSRGQRGGSLTALNLSFLDRNGYFSFK
jgi:hypothetical protein